MAQLAAFCGKFRFARPGQPAARFLLGRLMQISVRGGSVQVDEPDVVAMAGRVWRIHRRLGQTPYCVAWNDDQTKLLFLHRVLMVAPDGVEVDHVNGDGLDNRRCNIRLATRAQNAKNRKAQTNCSSPFKGVSVRVRKHARFVAQIKQDGHCLRIGTFDSEHQAARAYDGAARLFHGKFARTNKELGLFALYPDRTHADIHLT